MRTAFAAAAACLALTGLCACERGGEAPTNTDDKSSRAEQARPHPDRGVMRPIDTTRGTGPASAPYAHATASDPSGAAHVYGEKNADTFRLREGAPAAIGGGPPSVDE